MTKTWLKATDAMTLLPGDVHVWCLDLRVLPDESLLVYLSDSEHQRAERFKCDKAKAVYKYGHAVLRDILSRYLSIEPNAITFQIGEHGKPYLSAALWNKQELQFNLSHAGDFVYYALTLQHELGVDIECVQRSTRWAEVAKRFFSKGEQEELWALPVAEQERGFYRGWVRKEAFIKAIGRGLTYGLQDFSVGLAARALSHIYSIKDAHLSAFPWTLCSLIAPSNIYEAALAVSANINDIQYYSYKTTSR